MPAVIHSVARSNAGSSLHSRRPRAASSAGRRTANTRKRRRKTTYATNATAPANMTTATHRSCCANGAAYSAYASAAIHIAAGTANAATAPRTRGTAMRSASSVPSGSGAPGIRRLVSIRAHDHAFQHHSSVASSRIAICRRSRRLLRRAANSRSTSCAWSLASSATVPIATNTTENRASHSTRPSARSQSHTRSHSGSGGSGPGMVGFIACVSMPPRYARCRGPAMRMFAPRGSGVARRGSHGVDACAEVRPDYPFSLGPCPQPAPDDWPARPAAG